MTLYEFTGPVKELYELLQAEEIDEQTFRDTVEGLGVDDKLERCCELIRQFKLDAAMYAEEIKRVTAKKKAAENGKERIERLIGDFLSATGQTKARAGTFSVSVSPSRAVEIYEAALVPEQYVFTEKRIDKKAIGEAMAAGETVPGAGYKNETIVRIR